MIFILPTPLISSLLFKLLFITTYFLTFFIVGGDDYDKTSPNDNNSNQQQQRQLTGNTNQYNEVQQETDDQGSEKDTYSQTQVVPSFVEYQHRVLIAPSAFIEHDRSLQVHVKLESTVVFRSVGGIYVSPIQEQLEELFNTNNNVTKIHVQMGNIASQSFPMAPLDLLDDARLVTGPAGLWIEAQFDEKIQRNTDDTMKNDPSFNSYQNYRNQFLALLRDMVGKYRYIIAPVASLDNPRLHRWIHVGVHSDVTNQPSVSTGLPITGAWSMLSAEGFVAFLKSWQQVMPFACTSNNSVLWNVKDALTWSNWMLNVDTTTTTTKKKKEQTVQTEISRYHRKSMYMEWNKQADQISYTMGIQYALTLRQKKMNNNQTQSLQMNVSIQDLLPPKLSSLRQKQKQRQQPTCPYSQGNLIHVIVPEKRDTSTIVWNVEFVSSSCQVSTNKINTKIPFTAILLDPSKTCFLLESQTNRGGGVEKNVQNAHIKSSERMELLSTSIDNTDNDKTSVNLYPWWHVHLNVWRYGGLHGDGTLTTTIHNDHLYCPVTVSVVQAFPYIIQPIWRSLHGTVITGRSLNQTLTTNLSNSSEKYHHKHQNNQYVAWSDLEYYNVEFPDDGDTNKFILIEYQYTLTPQSKFILSMDYRAAYVSFEWFPGDANRGFEFPPVQATFQLKLTEHDTKRDNYTNLLDDTCKESLQLWQQNFQNDNTIGSNRVEDNDKNTVLFPPVLQVDLYSNAVLVLAPLPDMSMPFNVLSFTCTLYAFVIGTMFNLLVKKANSSIKEKLNPKPKEPTKLTKIKLRIREKITKIQNKFRLSSTATVSTIHEDNISESKKKED